MYAIVLLDDLSEEHLSDSYHATPAGICNIGAFDVMIDFREAWSIGEPGGLVELFIQEFDLLV